jgi:peptidyl-prolyl cis-trans isomerase A (cyclophilin A)
VRKYLAATVAILLFTAAGAANTAPAPVRGADEASLPVGWYADVTTTLGAFTIHLLPQQDPQTVAHFVGFATGTIEYTDPFTGEKKKGPFYDGLKIHRIVPNQRFEAGDPTGTTRGAPPFWVPKEDGPIEFSLPYRVGMTASTGQRISGVLFFVSAVDEPALDASHNCFGEVVRGRDTVDRIVHSPADVNHVPINGPSIEHVKVYKVGDPPPIPAPVRYRPVTPVPKLRVPVEDEP